MFCHERTVHFQNGKEGFGEYRTHIFCNVMGLMDISWLLTLMEYITLRLDSSTTQKYKQILTS